MFRECASIARSGGVGDVVWTTVRPRGRRPAHSPRWSSMRSGWTSGYSFGSRRAPLSGTRRDLVTGGADAERQAAANAVEASTSRIMTPISARSRQAVSDRNGCGCALLRGPPRALQFAMAPRRSSQHSSQRGRLAASQFSERRAGDLPHARHARQAGPRQ